MKSQQDEEIVLKSGELTAYVSPWGASLRGLVLGQSTQIITRYSGAAKTGGQGDVLIPFPGRIRGGEYSIEGKEYSLERNDKDGPNAIHGFLRMRPWNTVSQSDSEAVFAIDLKGDDAQGYPFPLHVEVSYEVSPEGLTVKFRITNTGTVNAPVGAGFHPYFTVGTSTINDVALTLPFQSYLEFDDALLPTGQIQDINTADYDFRHERLIGRTQFNTCFLNPIRNAEGNAVINLRSSDAYTSLRVILGPDLNYVVLYSGDPLPESHRRKALAIEPMTCGSDAFNFPDWGLKVLNPGDSFAGTWRVEYSVS